jgi:hypothetical protein
MGRQISMPQGTAAMSLEQLVGRHFRLQRELSVAYSMLPWQTDWINRLAHDLAAAEREIAALRQADEQSSGALPRFDNTGAPTPA